MNLQTPRKIQIDASSHCQLACPVCPTANGLTRRVLGSGHLKLVDFERLLDGNPGIREVELSNYGEMFLNPQLPALLACAWERDVVVSGRNGVNLNFATDEALDAVVRYRVRALTCSIDGATQETYSRYRVNGNLDRVLKNVDRIREFRQIHRSAFPVLDWQFVVMGHNEHELAPARAMARARGMHFMTRLSWNEEHSPVTNRDLVSIETGLGSAGREEFREKTGTEYTRDICYQLWRAPVINWNGKMLGCCVNFWGDFGSNVFEEGLPSAMLHPKLESARQMLMGRGDAQGDVPCTNCQQFLSMSRARNWITAEELEFANRDEILAGVIPESIRGARVARVSVVRGRSANSVFGPSGEVFRFGIDTAFYFEVVPGTCMVTVQYLEASGWGQVRNYVLDISAKPVRQEFHLDRATDTRNPIEQQTSQTTELPQPIEWRAR